MQDPVQRPYDCGAEDVVQRSCYCRPSIMAGNGETIRQVLTRGTSVLMCFSVHKIRREDTTYLVGRLTEAKVVLPAQDYDSLARWWCRG